MNTVLGHWHVQCIQSDRKQVAVAPHSGYQVLIHPFPMAMKQSCKTAKGNIYH